MQGDARRCRQTLARSRVVFTLRRTSLSLSVVLVCDTRKVNDTELEAEVADDSATLGGESQRLDHAARVTEGGGAPGVASRVTDVDATHLASLLQAVQDEAVVEASHQDVGRQEQHLLAHRLVLREREREMKGGSGGVEGHTCMYMQTNVSRRSRATCFT